MKVGKIVMSNARKNYLRFINNRSSKNLLISKLESLYFAVNGETYKLPQDNVAEFVVNVTYDIITMLSDNFNNYSMLFNLETHNSKYYIEKIDQLARKNFSGIEKIVEERSNSFNGEDELSEKNILATKIAQRFLINLENLTKYSVEDIIKNQQEILK